ncbi:1,5-anhydro-D-fructose reductase [Pirellula sp. SH-Sr6A]|uniref:Gfo/Idh/MocA family protein n=1 Tax=Pirellula sp. SH-Sr6A TaxID=1632865 RepID=UPI00078E1D17|nr:Gfo/Idh/MocA family oxidoreductase [Pirellula sp. SH-Sr6A]AMV32213.1 1,5-anhydro-D-fructose reductase [Pirellula sp. SH-Sr6A]
MRWAFLGVGRVTPRMVEAVRLAGHSITAAAARDPVALQKWCETHQVAKSTHDFHSLCDADDIDVIYVALPPHLHTELAIRALKSGKRVLCEKPLTAHLEDSRRLHAVVSQYPDRFCHASAFPFHPRSRAMRDLIAGGAIGEVTRATFSCSFSHVLQRGRDYRTDPSAGGGCLLDLGWYCALATQWFTGERPSRIQAMGRRHADHGIWLSAQAIVELQSGAFAHWDCGFDAPGRKWMEIAGTKGSVICDDFLRPWDASKPRFWVHGSDGKARSEMVGENVNQEARMIESLWESNHHAIDLNQLTEFGFQAQETLAAWEYQLIETSIHPSSPQ